MNQCVEAASQKRAVLLVLQTFLASVTPKIPNGFLRILEMLAFNEIETLLCLIFS